MAQVFWGLDKTRWLYTGEPASRSAARAEAAEWLAAHARADDVLFGYEPTWLDAWGRGAPYGALFIPRADAKLALETLEEADQPLGHGVWLLDASDFVDQDEGLNIHVRRPGDSPFSDEARQGRQRNVVASTGRVQEFEAAAAKA